MDSKIQDLKKKALHYQAFLWLKLIVKQSHTGNNMTYLLGKQVIHLYQQKAC